MAYFRDGGFRGCFKKHIRRGTQRVRRQAKLVADQARELAILAHFLAGALRCNSHSGRSAFWQRSNDQRRKTRCRFPSNRKKNNFSLVQRRSKESKNSRDTMTACTSFSHGHLTVYPPGSVEWLSPDEFLSVACCAGFDSTDVTWMDTFESICLEYGCDPAVGVTKEAFLKLVDESFEKRKHYRDDDGLILFTCDISPGTPSLSTIQEAQRDITCSEHIDAIITWAASAALEQAVGQYEASAVVRAARQTASLLSTPTESLAQWERQAVSICDLTRMCIGLAASVEKDYDDGSRVDFDLEDIDWDWEFGIVVADLIGHGLAAMVNILDSRIGDDCEEIAMNLLEELGRELDCLAAHIFGGLKRLGPHESCHSIDRCHQRLCCALQYICSWALAAVCHGVGFHRFSACVLWEWVCSDPLWAFVLVKGVFLSSPADDGQANCPSNIRDLQQVVFVALIGLASVDVAFAAELAGEVVLQQNDEYNTIVYRNMWLATHRTHIAIALVDSNILELLIDVSKKFNRGDMLLTFLNALLQTDLVDDPAWASLCEEGVARLDEVQRSRFALQKQLEGCTENLWICLANSCHGATSPAAFLAESADLAYFAPPSHPLGYAFIDNCLSQLLDTNEGLSDPCILAALCVFGANVGITPTENDGALFSLLGDMGDERRQALTDRLQKWRGPVDAPRMSEWAVFANSSFTYGDRAVRRSPVSQPLGTVASQAPLRCGPLQGLLQDAPVEFRCPIDGHLMMDPVRTPQGHVCDRQALADVLLKSNGLCPFSNLQLCISECVRLPELRRQITQWVRKARPSASKNANLQSRIV